MDMRRRARLFVPWLVLVPALILPSSTASAQPLAVGLFSASNGMLPGIPPLGCVNQFHSFSGVALEGGFVTSGGTFAGLVNADNASSSSVGCETLLGGSGPMTLSFTLPGIQATNCTLDGAWIRVRTEWSATLTGSCGSDTTSITIEGQWTPRPPRIDEWETDVKSADIRAAFGLS